MRIKPGRIFNLSALIILLCSCGTETEERSLIIQTIAEEFIVDGDAVVYQYYQKFGFTDLCEDITHVIKTNNSPNLSKHLPMTEEDLVFFNKVSKADYNKDHDRLLLRCSLRTTNQDVELEFNEYCPDPSLVIKLKSGEYEIVESKLNQIIRIFDMESGLYFVEVHRCDGT